MRTFGSLIEKRVKFREPPIPGSRLERANPSTATRLNDGITELFDFACVANELELAADLATLMAKWHEGRSYDDEQQKRIGAIRLKRMCGELERRYIMRGSHPPLTGSHPGQGLLIGR
jgi:hypothetical protein